MRVPYETEEIATQVVREARRLGLEVTEVEVKADVRMRIWRLRARLADGETRSATLPFSTPAGVYTPAELALRLLGGNWFIA